jgi:hypothetical protein
MRCGLEARGYLGPFFTEVAVHPEFVFVPVQVTTFIFLPAAAPAGFIAAQSHLFLLVFCFPGGRAKEALQYLHRQPFSFPLQSVPF